MDGFNTPQARPDVFHKRVCPGSGTRNQQQGRVGEVNGEEFLCQDLEAKLFKWFLSRFDAPRIIAARHKELVESGLLKEGYDEAGKSRK